MCIFISTNRNSVIKRTRLISECVCETGCLTGAVEKHSSQNHLIVKHLQNTQKPHQGFFEGSPDIWTVRQAVGGETGGFGVFSKSPNHQLCVRVKEQLNCQSTSDISLLRV